MKLWPFSKKTSDGALDSNMDLPPGVVLAAPDASGLSDLPLPSVPSPPLEIPMTTAAQANELPAVDPGVFSPEIQQILGHAPAADMPEQAPSNALPDLPSELFANANADPAFLPPHPTESPIATIGMDAAPMEGNLWMPSDPASFPLPLSMEAPAPEMTIPESPNLQWESTPTAVTAAPKPLIAEAPSLIPDTATTEPILSELFLDSVMAAPPSRMDLPPVAESNPSSSMMAEPEPFVWTPSVEPQVEAPSDAFSEALFYEPAGTTFAQDFDPLTGESGLEAFGALNTALPLGALNDNAAPAGSSDMLANLLTQAEEVEASTQSPIPQEATEVLTFMGEPAPCLEPMPASDDSTFFASASFDAMDGFGQISDNGGLFSIEPSVVSPDGAFLPNDAESNAPANDAGMAWAPSDCSDASQAWQEGASSDLYAMEGATAFIPGQTLADDEEGEGDANFCEWDEGESLGEGELSSYDLGHYDDPDEPVAAFVLDETPEESLLTTEQDVNPLLTQSAMYYIEEKIEEASSPAESAVDYSPEESALPEPMSTVQPMQQAATLPQQPVPEPLSKTLPAAVRKAEQPIPPKLPPRHTYYQDSITEALNTFEQEVLLRDSRFLKQSINNLVERYFAQNEPETEW